MSSSSSPPKHLNFITGNKNKLAEVQAILKGVIELRNENVDLVEIQGTVDEVTSDKARRAAEAVSLVMFHLLCFNACAVCFGRFHEQQIEQLTFVFIVILGAYTNILIDSRPRARRRHMSLLQGHERPAGTIHVSTIPKESFNSPSIHPKAVF